MAVEVGSNIETLGIRTELVDNELATQQLQQLGATGEATAQRIATAGKRASSTFSQSFVQETSRATSTFASFASGLIAPLAGITGLTLFTHKLLSETIEAQNAMAQLEVAVHSTGGAAGRTVQQMDDLSIALQGVTTFSDEAIKSAETMLTTFDKVNGDTFDRATRAAADLAARMGGDVAGAARMVGKALQEPDEGLSQLNRQFRLFSEGERAAIKAMVEAGDTAKAQTVILTALETKFGGAALAARNTLGGALTHLKNVFGDLFEASNQSTAGVVSGINAMADALPRVGEGFSIFFRSLVAGWHDVKLAMDLATLQPGNDFFDRAQALIKERNLALSRLRGDWEGVSGGSSSSTRGGVAAGALGGGDESAQKAIANARAQLAVQQALNAAYGQSALAIKELEIHMKALGDRQALRIEYSGKELAALLGLNQAQEAADIQAARLAQSTKDAADATAYYDSVIDKLADSLDNLGPKMVVNQIAAQAEALKQFAIDIQRVWLEHPPIPANLPEQTKVAVDHMGAIWRDGFSRIITDGTKSWHDFFEDVLQLFSKLMREMERKAKEAKLEPGGFAYNAFGVASSAIAGGLAGYQLGQNFGTTGGVLGGAAAGAIIGNTILPGLGAAVGGLAGAAGGLLGAADAQRKAAEEFRAAIKAFEQSAERFVMASGGNATGTQLLDLRQQFEALKSFADLQTVFFGFAGNLFGSEAAKGKSTEFAKTSADIDAAYKKYIERLTTTFTDSLTEGLNALNGPAGEYANHLAAIKKQYDDNIATAQALIADAKERKASEAELAALNANLAKVEELRAAQEAALAEALARATQQATEDLQVRRLVAEGHASEADALRFQLDQQRELENLAKSLDLTDPAQAAELALLKVVLGLEATQHAADAAAAAMQAAASDIARDVQLGFTTPQAAIEQERQALGFGGLTNEQIRALYTPYTGTALTPEQETQNANIAKFLQDLAQFMGTGGVSAAATRNAVQGSTQAVTYAAEALTEVTGNRMADYLDTIAVYVREIVGLLRSRVAGNAVAAAALSNSTQSVASSSLAPTVNLASRNSITGLGVPLYQPQPIAPQGVGGSGEMGDTLTQWFTGRVLQKPAGPEQPPVINVTLPSIAVTVQITQAVPDAMTLARDIGDVAARQISRKLAPSLNAELARLTFGQRLRDGDPTKAG